MSLTTKLREYAKEGGVDLIGIATAKPFHVHEQRLINPQDYLPNAKSVVVSAYYFYDGQTTIPSVPGTPRGRIGPGTRAFPAMAEHCQKVIQKFLTDRGYNARISDEDIPLKPMAVRAGIGFYGKNCIVHTEEYGSYIELGCLITDALLEGEERPYKLSDCDDCNICIEACPTGAIFEPYKLNRSSCICLWMWGDPIPLELRGKAGNRIFRCEACQEACPKNQNLEPRQNFPIKLETTSDNPELIPLLLGDEDYYQATMPRFALSAGVETLRRNVAIALGNIGDQKAVPALTKILEHPDSRVRSYADWALENIGTLI
jgi:epoxyqueuosine reductase